MSSSVDRFTQNKDSHISENTIQKCLLILDILSKAHTSIPKQGMFDASSLFQMHSCSRGKAIRASHVRDTRTKLLLLLKCAIYARRNTHKTVNKLILLTYRKLNVKSKDNSSHMRDTSIHFSTRFGTCDIVP